MENSQPRNRRDVLRLMGAGALAAMVAGGLASPALAGRGWCWRDPVVKIDGKVADIRIGGDEALDETATGPTQIVVLVPPGVTTELLATDQGFNKQGYAISFAEDAGLTWGDDGPQVVVQVFVSAPVDGLPVQVNFAPRSLRLAPATAYGASNQWISLSAS